MNESNVDELKRMIRNNEGVLSITPVEEVYIARGLIRDIDMLKRCLMEQIGLEGEYDG